MNMLKFAGSFLSTVLLIALSGNDASAQKAYEIVPLITTREEVDRLFKNLKVETTLQERVYHVNQNEKVRITFSNGPCVQSGPHRWRVEKDVVLVVHIWFRKSKRLSELPFDSSTFAKLPGDRDLPETFYYLNEDRGMSIQVYTQIDDPRPFASDVFLFPRKDQRDLRCEEA